MLTEIGPVEIDVPRDTDSSFEPKIVRKRQRRLTGIDEIVLSLSAKGLTTGEISAHFQDIYGASVSKDTISRITDKVLEEMTEWQNRPLDRVYPVVFIDAIHVKIRDGQVTNRPIYVAIGVTVNGERDILGLWAGDGGEGAKFFAGGAHRDQEPWSGRCVHRGLRRAQGSAGCDQYGVGVGGGADLHHSPDPQHFSVRTTSALGISMLLSSSRSEGCRVRLLVVGAVAQHRPQGSDPPTCKGDQRLLVTFAFGAFAVVEPA